MKSSSLVVSVGAGALLPVLLAVPAGAAPVGFPVHLIAHTVFGGTSTFESNIPGCVSGTVEEGADSRTTFTPWGGLYIGTKKLTCTGGAAGFDVRLRARFGEDGSTGSWVIADAWGSYDGVKGSGTLVGIPISDTQIDDVYTGTAR